MNLYCEHCGAKHFNSEKVVNKGNSFNDCCSHGTVELNSLPQPPHELYKLFTENHPKSNQFIIVFVVTIIHFHSRHLMQTYQTLVRKDVDLIVLKFKDKFIIKLILHCIPHLTKCQVISRSTFYCR